MVGHLPQAEHLAEFGPFPEDLLQAEEQVVAASVEVDVARYTPLHQDVRRGWVDAVEHFCRQGWKELDNPGRGVIVIFVGSKYPDGHDAFLAEAMPIIESLQFDLTPEP